MDPDIELYQEALRLKRAYRRQRDALRRAGEQMKRMLEHCSKLQVWTDGESARIGMALKAWEMAQ